MIRAFWKRYLKSGNWTIVGDIPKDLEKYVIIVAPHTSNWDFIIGLAVRSVKRMKTKFLGKKELFKFPFGFIFRWLGGYPVDRSESQNIVDVVAGIFDEHEEFSIALSPEGTRSKVDRLRTGFYHIAKKANVPIVMAAIDYAEKKVIFDQPFYPKTEENDFSRIINFYKDVKGKYPENGIKHLAN